MGDIKYDNIFVPFRICPLGAHIDHQLGNVTGFAIDKGITIKYKKTLDGSFNVTSHDFKGCLKFNYSNLPKKNNTWQDYLIGSIKVLQEKYELKYGINGYISESLPIGGGLGSSSTIIILYLLVLSKVNNILLTKNELVSLTVKVENVYFNKKVGVLDPFCQIYGKKNELLYIDTKDNDYCYIKPQKNMNFKICLIYTGVSRNLVDTLYNVRVDECKKAANIMNTFKQNSQLEFSDLFLRNFTINDFEKVKSFLPLNLEKRCLHFYGEMNRVKAGVSYFRNGNISKFGQLIFASGNSSIKNYETGSKILETLHSILLNADGVYGGRFSGAGFNGYYMALVDPKKEESLKKYVTDTYLKIYPEYEGKFKIVFCNTSDGVKL